MNQQTHISQSTVHEPPEWTVYEVTVQPQAFAATLISAAVMSSASASETQKGGEIHLSCYAAKFSFCIGM